MAVPLSLVRPMTTEIAKPEVEKLGPGLVTGASDDDPSGIQNPACPGRPESSQSCLSPQRDNRVESKKKKPAIFDEPEFYRAQVQSLSAFFSFS